MDRGVHENVMALDSDSDWLVVSNFGEIRHSSMSSQYQRWWEGREWKGDGEKEKFVIPPKGRLTLFTFFSFWIFKFSEKTKKIVILKSYTLNIVKHIITYTLRLKLINFFFLWFFHSLGILLQYIQSRSMSKIKKIVLFYIQFFQTLSTWSIYIILK